MKKTYRIRKSEFVAKTQILWILYKNTVPDRSTSNLDWRTIEQQTFSGLALKILSF